jgi:hypothetical protein
LQTLTKRGSTREGRATRTRVILWTTGQRAGSNTLLIEGEVLVMKGDLHPETQTEVITSLLILLEMTIMTWAIEGIM